MPQLKTSLILDLVDRISKPAKKVTKELEKIEKSAGDVAGFRKLKKETIGTSKKLEAMQKQTKDLAEKMRRAEKPSKKLSASFERAKRNAKRYKVELSGQSRELQKLRHRLTEAGISTKQLSRHQRMLNQSTKGATQALKKQQKRLVRTKATAKAKGAGAHGGHGGGGPVGMAGSMAGGMIIAGGVMGLGASIANVGNLERRFTRLGIDANKPVAAMNRLKNKIFDVAQQKDTRVNPNEIAAAIERVIRDTGDDVFAEKNLRNIALTMQATGADGATVGGLFSELRKQGIVDSKAVRRVISTNAKQGKEGAFTLTDFARLGPRIVNAYAAVGRSDEVAQRELGAVMQVIRQGTGSPDEAATSFESLITSFSRPEVIKKLRAGGVGLYTKEDANKLRPANEIMTEIVQKAGGSRVLIQQIIGEVRAVRAFNSILGEYNRTSKVTSLDKFMKLQDDGTSLIKDSTRAANDFNSAVENLNTSWKRYMDRSLKPAINLMGEFMQMITSKEFDQVVGKGIATVLASMGNETAQGALDAEAEALRQSKIRAKKLGAAQNMVYINGVPTYASPEMLRATSIDNALADGFQRFFNGELKSSVDINIKADGTFGVANLKSNNKNQTLNVMRDNGATLVTE